MNTDNLFTKHKNTILDSISTYKKALMSDMNLTIRLNYQQNTYLTRLVDWSESIVIFEAPMRGIDDVILPRETNLDVILVSKVGLFYTTFFIQKNYRQDNKLYYVAQISSAIVKKQQREAFRLDILLDVQYSLIPKNDEITNPIQSMDGTCVNISLGGMCLVCDQQFHTNDQLNLSFLLMDTLLQFKGEVLYLGEKTEQARYAHRIRFIDLKFSDIELLNRLIFEKQRLQLRHT